MTEPSRIEFLRQGLETSPDNTFMRYALALELTNSERPEQAWEQFKYLLERHPDYAATYLQAGMYLVKQGNRQEAHDVFQKGIEVMRRQGNLHALSELEAALEDLGEDF